MRKKRLLGGLIGIGALVIWGVTSIVYTMLSDQETSSKIPLTEYNNLFSKNAQAELKILATVKSWNRLPVCTYIFEGKFNVCVFKVNLSDASALDHIIDYQNGASSKSFNAVYAGLPSHNFDMSIKAGRSVKVTRLHFKFSGDSIRSIVQNDSVYCYYYKFRSFSVSYNNEPYDIIANSDVSDIPACIMFKKRNRFLYVILMTVRSGEERMQPDILNNVIEH